MIFALSLVAFGGIVIGGMIWIFVSTYKSQKEWSDRHKIYSKAQELSEKIHVMFQGTVEDSLRIKVRDDIIVNIVDEYLRPKNADQGRYGDDVGGGAPPMTQDLFRFDVESFGEFVTGQDYFCAYDYYYLMSIDPRELLDKIRPLVYKNIEEIEAARVYWEPLLNDLENMLENLSSDKSNPRIPPILGFYHPITEEQYIEFKNIYEKGGPGKLPKLDFFFYPFCSESGGLIRNSKDTFEDGGEKLIEDDET